MNTSLLKGEIVAKYDSQKNFSKAIGWPQNKLSRMMTQKYIPDIAEASKIKTMLELDSEKASRIFLE